MRKVIPPKGKGSRKARVAKKAARARGGLQALVGMFASRTGDLAARHDDFLYGWKKQELC
ncbi:MAG: hypothetical protein HY766_16260 [candidate division NC10 bacterium]|nr:hypothetical protein [candidate division NC10 bacterium]